MGVVIKMINEKIKENIEISIALFGLLYAFKGFAIDGEWLGLPFLLILLFGVPYLIINRKGI